MIYSSGSFSRPPRRRKLSKLEDQGNRYTGGGADGLLFDTVRPPGVSSAQSSNNPTGSSEKSGLGPSAGFA
jgi:hypothetical protein